MKANTNFQLILIALVILLSILLVRSCNQTNYHKNQIKAISDTTRLYRNKAGQLIAEKQVFVGENKELKSEIERWKLLGDTLQTKLNRKTKQIVLLNRQIEITKTGTYSKPKNDTIYIANTIIDTPSLSIDTGDKYHNLKFAANKNRYAYEINVTDDSELKVEESNKGTTVTLLNKNPYVTYVDIKSVSIAPKKPSFLNKIIYLVTGLGIGFLVFK